jgi:hypothetical protein
MIPVSDAWKQAQREMLVPEAFIEIKYFITDPDVQGDLSVTVNNKESISTMNDVIDGVDETFEYYTTLEDGVFLLNGNQKYIANPKTTGYISSEICGDDGVFSTPIVITFNTSKIHENAIPGVTLIWSNSYNEYPVRFSVAAYRNNSLVGSKLVTDNKSVKNDVFFDFSNFNKIVVTVYEWCLPQRRCRLESMMVGIYSVYTKRDLMSYEHEQSCDLLSGSLPKNAISFKFDNSDSKWNPLNKDGLNKYILERQEVSVRYGYDINGKTEWINVGDFYLNEWSTPNNGLEASFVARDLVEFMNGAYTGIREGSLYDICKSALELANLPLAKDGGKRYVISDVLKQYNTVLDDADYKIKEIVQLCANASCCIVHQDHSGKIKIEPYSLLYSYYPLDNLVNYSWPEITVSKEIRAVDVNKGLGQYTISPKGEVQTLDNDMIQSVSHANTVAKWVGETLGNRSTISGSARLDPRLEATDMITVQSKFETVHGVYVTDVKLTYNGAFKGDYKGRLFEFKAQPASYVGLPYSNEV